MRGRRPEPNAIREQKAAVRSVRKRGQFGEEGLNSGVVRPPTWLKGEGRQVWNRLAPTLRQVKLLSDADTATFGRYCRNFARWLKMQRTLDDEGETYETETYGHAEGAAETPRGKLKRVNPAFMVADRIERQLLAAEDRFGLNPAERQRIFAARAQTGVSGDLFAGETKRPGDPATEPTEPAQPIENPVGFLN